MSTSMLYHTFGIVGVQYISTDFLAERPSSAALFIPTISSARTVNPAMSSGSANIAVLSKCCLSAIRESNLSLKSPGYNAKNAVP